ncbi:MAG: hypothetical protein K1X79_01230 [Oligoflexia bacterium]|nr:hypothetical protein [Oligoflexia bacterium]
MSTPVPSPGQNPSALLALIPAGIDIPCTCPETHSRAPFVRHPDPTAPNRFDLNGKPLSWRSALPGYTPPRWTSPLVLQHYAQPLGDERSDPAEPSRIERRALVSVFDRIQFDEEGAPINPAGRTGLRDRGSLWLWGPNHVTDLVVTRVSKDGRRIEVALVSKHLDWGGTMLALIGGHRKIEEDARVSSAREAIEESNIELDPNCLVQIGHGYMDSAINTDNAWLECVVFHAHFAYRDTAAWVLQPRDTHEIEAAAWHPVTPELFASLPHTHRPMLAASIRRLAACWS